MGLFDDIPSAQGGGLFDDIPAAPKADPKIGKPEELSFAEKYVAPILERMTMFREAEKAGISRGGAVGRVAMGAADPGVAVVQMAANALPGGAGEAVNKAIVEKEAEYEEARKGKGSEGFDPLRAAGSIAMTAPLGAGGAGLVRGALMGGGAAALDPVRDGGENFWQSKAEQAGTGAAAGAVLSPLMRGLARIVSPNASVNADVALLKSEGVRPTLGMAAGGWANALEEKMTSVPILGDAISAARRGVHEQFNTAAINRTVAPIGGKVSGAGNEAIAEAGDQLSGAYQAALAKVPGVNFANPTFIGKLGQLEQMATGLSEPMQRVWTRELGEVMRKVSPNGSVLGADLKMVDSRLGKIAAEYRGSGDPAQRELGDAVKQLQAIFKEQVGDQFPQVAKALKEADAGWAQLVRVEGAGKKAMNRDGVFTPSQYNMAVREADKSTRKRATARGTALGQDLGSAAQNVLGNKVPDSGTPGRVLSAVGAMGSAAVHPGIPLALTAGAAMYSKPIQNLLVEILTSRPDQAPAVANYLRQLIGPAAVASGALSQEFH